MERVLREISGTKGEDEQYCIMGGGGGTIFYSVPNVAAIIDWRRIRCAGM